jgi:hypothetical protein
MNTGIAALDEAAQLVIGRRERRLLLRRSSPAGRRALAPRLRLLDAYKG